MGDIGADERAAGETEGNSERKSGRRTRPPLGREIVGEECVGGGDAARLSEADSEPAEEQLPIALGDTAQGGECAPDRQGAGDHPAAASLVGEDGERNTE